MTRAAPPVSESLSCRGCARPGFALLCVLLYRYLARPISAPHQRTPLILAQRVERAMGDYVPPARSRTPVTGGMRSLKRASTKAQQSSVKKAALDATVLGNNIINGGDRAKHGGPFAAMASSFASAAEEANDILTRLQALETSMQKLQGSHDALRGSHDALRGSHDALQGSHDALRGSHDALQGSHDALRGSNDALKHSHVSLQRSNDAMRDCFDKLLLRQVSVVVEQTLTRLAAQDAGVDLGPRSTLHFSDLPESARSMLDVRMTQFGVIAAKLNKTKDGGSLVAREEADVSAYSTHDLLRVAKRSLGGSASQA